MLIKSDSEDYNWMWMNWITTTESKKSKKKIDSPCSGGKILYMCPNIYIIPLNICYITHGYLLFLIVVAIARTFMFVAIQPKDTHAHTPSTRRLLMHFIVIF